MKILCKNIIFLLLNLIAYFLMVLVFFTIITPLGLILKIFNIKLIKENKKNLDSYWVKIKDNKIFKLTSILGISAFYHDSAAAIIVDGQIVAAAQEERFTRVKHDSRYPFNAIEFVLKYQKLICQKWII